MKNWKIISLAICLIISGGCIKLPEMPTVSGPYIKQYYDGPGICEIGADWNGNIRLYFGIDFNSDDLETFYSGASGNNGTRYKALCDKHGDNGYEGKDPFAGKPQKICYAKDFKSLTITALSNYDPEHPAGSSLDDIAVYDAYTPYPWIKSGYDGMPEFTHYVEYVKDVAPEAMTMLCYSDWFSIYFATPPAVSSTVKMKITLTTDEDEVIEFEKDVILL